MAGSVAAGRARVAPPRRTETISASAMLAVVEYCARVYRKTWRGTLFMTFFSPILFLGAMGFGLGQFVDEGAGAGATAALGVASYAAFLAPGLLAVTCMQTATFEASYPVMGRLTWDKVYHAMLATPVSVSDIVVGQIGWFAVRLSMVAAAYYLIMVVFGLVPGGPASILVVPVGVLTGLSFAGPVAAFSATQQNDNGFSIIFRFVVMPLFLFSGTFFPVEQLPDFLEPIAWLTPTFHGVALARDLTLGTLEPLTAALHVGVLVGYVLAGIAACLVTFRRGLVK